MANPNRPHGFVPAGTLNGAAWNGQTRRYFIAASDTNAYYIGDPVVISSGGSDGSYQSILSQGVQLVTKAAAGDTVRGVIADIIPDIEDLEFKSIPATKKHAYFIDVVDDPTVTFEIQADGDVTPAALGSFANFTIATPTNKAQVSNVVLATSTISSSTTSLPLRILGLAQGTFGLYARLLVQFNRHDLASTGKSVVTATIDAVTGVITSIPTITGLVADLTSAAAANSTIIAAALAVAGDHALPTGKFYVNADVLKATARGTLRGVGANNGAYFWSTSQAGNLAEQSSTTCLACVSRTGWILGIDISGFSVRGIHFQNESAVNGAGIATAGGGVRVGSLLASTGIASSQANGTSISECSFYGCYVGIDHYSADSYVISECRIHNFVAYGIQINNSYNPSAGNVSDLGDPVISGNQITSGLFSASATGIRWVSGGGLKIVGNKINGNGLGNPTYYLTNGIHFDPASTTNTSVFVIVGNSIEGITGGSCIKIAHTTDTANCSFFTITGNEFQTSGTGSGITIAGRASGAYCSNGFIGGNIFNNCCGSGGITMSYALSWEIGKNVFAAMAANQYAITLGEIVADCDFEEQKCQSTSWASGDFIGQINDTSTGGTSVNPAGAFGRNVFRHQYSQTVNFATKQAAAANFFFVGPSASGKAGCRIRVVVEGQMEGLNANLFYTGERAVMQTWAGSCLMNPVANAATAAQPLFDQVSVNGVPVASIVTGTNTTSNSIVTIATGAEGATAGLNIQWLILDGTGVYIRLYHTSGSSVGATNAFRGTIHMDVLGTASVVKRYRNY